MNKITIIIADYGDLTNANLLSILMCNNIDFHMDTFRGQLLVDAPLNDTLEMYKDVVIPNCTFIEVMGSFTYVYDKPNKVVCHYDNNNIKPFN